MPRPTIIERARLYTGAMPAAISGSGGHNATFAVACVLVKGFALSIDQARPLLQEFNQRCQPPWGEKQIEHKLRQADTTPDPQPRGYLLGDNAGPVGDVPATRRAAPPPPKPPFDPLVLKAFAGEWSKVVDLLWLANRSAVDPATVTSADFLSALYGAGERVLIFNQCTRGGQQVTQGEALWPDEETLPTGKYGVWFLPQPVDGEYHPNPRSEKNKMSRRSEESVLRFPFLVLESDTAPLRDWLGALVQLPLRIVAIYTSGGRSVHALVRVSAQTKKQWDDIKAAMMPGLRFLLTNGLDKGVLSAVRLSRLPQAWREGKVKEESDGSFSYVKFERRQLQKLLYLNPGAKARPICELMQLRDVEADWLAQSQHGIADSDETGGRWLRWPLRYYAPVSAKLREAHLRVEAEWKEQVA